MAALKTEEIGSKQPYDEEQLLDILESLEMDWKVISGKLPDLTLFCDQFCSPQVLFETSHLSKNFQRGATKKLNMTHSHPQDIKNYACPYEFCGKMYAKTSHLRAHLRRHTGEKPFTCSWTGCIWKFSRSDELVRHMRSHSGMKPYACLYCLKRFSRSDHLGKHNKVHAKKTKNTHW